MPEVGRARACGGVRESGRLLTAAEVGERLGFTERYVWRLGREGVLPRIKLPGRKYVRFAEDDVERFIAGARMPPARERRRARDVPAGTLPHRF